MNLKKRSGLEDLPRKAVPLPTEVSFKHQIEQQRIVLLNLEDGGR